MCLGNINNNYGGGAKATAQAFPVKNGGVGVTGQIQSSDQSVTVTGTGVVNQSGKPLGGGIGVKTPVGPLRLDVATQDLSGKMRYTLGVGWKF